MLKEPIKGIKFRNTYHSGAFSISKIAWSPDGNMISAPLKNGTVNIYNIEKNSLFYEITEIDSLILDSAWSPDGKYLALGGADNIVYIYNIEARKIKKKFKGHWCPIRSLSWNPDGNFIASGSEDYTLRIRHSETGELHAKLHHDNRITSIAFSPDGNLIAASSDDMTVKVWDVNSRYLLRQFVGHRDYVLCVVWSPLGDIVCSCSKDRTIRFWNIKEGKHQLITGHEKTVRSVTYSCDGNLLASKSLDNTVRIWDCRNLKPLIVINEITQLKNWNTNIAFNPRKPILATLNEGDKGIRIWDINPDMLKEGAITFCRERHSSLEEKYANPNFLNGMYGVKKNNHAIGDSSKKTNQMNVFLSYAREDYQYAEKLYYSLKKHGIQAWFDRKMILAGQEWKTEISKAIHESSYFIALISSNSISKRGYVQKELQLALDLLSEFPKHSTFIIPVRLDDCMLIDEKLKNLHCVDLFESYDKGLKEILKTLDQLT